MIYTPIDLAINRLNGIHWNQKSRHDPFIGRGMDMIKMMRPEIEILDTFHDREEMIRGEGHFSGIPQIIAIGGPSLRRMISILASIFKDLVTKGPTAGSM
jgi:hypothetical protein